MTKVLDIHEVDYGHGCGGNTIYCHLHIPYDYLVQVMRNENATGIVLCDDKFGTEHAPKWHYEYSSRILGEFGTDFPIVLSKSCDNSIEMRTIL